MSDSIPAPLELVNPERLEWAAEVLSQSEVAPLDTKHLQAALLLADDRLPVGQIAGAIGVSERTIYLWQHKPGIKAGVAALRDRIHNETLAIGYGQRARRIAVLSDIADRLRDAIRSRAANPLDDLPETATGLFAVEQKTVGYGANSTVINVARFDAPLVDKLMTVLEQIAKEEGQVQERAQAALNGDITITFNVRGHDAELEEDRRVEITDASYTVTDVPALPAVVEGGRAHGNDDSQLSAGDR